jgi:outer membrane protein assembly factor BamA
MKTLVSLAAAGLGFLSCGCSESNAALRSLESKKISSVRLFSTKPLSRLEKSRLQRAIRIQEGNRYRQDDLDRDIIAIFNTGVAEDIEATASPLTDSVEVEFLVSPTR